MNGTSTGNRGNAKSYKVGVYGGGTGNTLENPASNNLRFKTHEEANQYGLDLLMRWTQPSDFVVLPSEDEVNR